MKLLIRQIKLLPTYTPEDLKLSIAKRLHTHPNNIENIIIIRRSVDARHKFKSEIYYIINAEVTISIELNIANFWQVESIAEENTPKPQPVQTPINSSTTRPIVIGSGPAGLFAALTLAERGDNPHIFERGKAIKERRKDVGLFWGKGILDPQSNVLYGEGGAGTFSDGKITSRSKDKTRTKKVREALYAAGAKEEVLYDAAFHIGSDKLEKIITSIRNKIIELGGEFHFQSTLEDFIIKDNILAGVIVNGKEYLTNNCYLATGHSAYDIYELLEKSGAILQSKPFATGIRVEIPQRAVNISQYGSNQFTKVLGAAPYALTLNNSCYTFCMCPGGSVIPCSTEEGSLFTNGMSLSSRSGKMANAAFLLPQSFSTYQEGRAHIKKMESAAYNIGDKDFKLPTTTFEQFPYACSTLPEDRSCKRAVAADFTKILPDQMCQDLQEYIPIMLSQLKNIDPAKAIITGPETRSSSLVKVLREENSECSTIKGLFPIGEGAGYSGGIMSSAIDGIKAVDNSCN